MASLKLLTIVGLGDCALIVNDQVVMTADPAMGDDVREVESVAERLAIALDTALFLLGVGIPAGHEDTWTWEEVAARQKAAG